MACLINTFTSSSSSAPAGPSRLFGAVFYLFLASDGTAVDRKAFSRRDESMNSNNGRNNNTTTKNLEKYQKNSEERQNAAILFLFCCRFLVAEWCKIHGREVAGRLHCLCHQLQEVENKEQLSIFPAKTPAVAASVTVSPLFTILHRKALSHQQVDDAIGIKCVSTRKFVAFECC